jgi:ornithine decarboxylase
MDCVIQDIISENQDITRFYLVDLGKISEMYSQWSELLPTVKPYYAIKCNPNPRIIETLNNLGINFDCASQSEIQQILDITQDPNRIIFANPCKTPDHIRYAQEKSVDLMTFDCEEELFKIQKYHPKARLVLRLSVDDSKSKMKFSKKFGCLLTNVKQLLLLSQVLDLNVVGFSFHVGSKCMSAMTYYYAIQDCKSAYDIAKEIGIQISIIDIGGGFSILDNFEDAASNINKGIDSFFGNEMLDQTIKFIAEPGRYFVETSHTLVLQVIGKKCITDHNTTMVYTVNESVYNSFNCIIFDCYIPDFKPLMKGSDKTSLDKLVEGFKPPYNTVYSTRVFGYSCDSMDLLAENVMLPNLYVGDWVYLENFGAYTYSASSSFNGFQSTQDFFYL